MKHLFPMMIAALVGCGGAPGDLWISRPGALTVSLAAQGGCAGGPAIAIRSAARDNPATPLTGLYVTVQQQGTMLASGWTPFTASDLCPGQEYTITAADYGSYRFTAWEDGTATWFRRVVLDASAEYTAVYQVGGSIVPLYSWPLDANGQASSTWREIAAAHQRWPGIALIPVVNNQNGPGPSRDDAWTSGIGMLAAAGCKVAGYVYTEYGARSLAAVETDIASWRAFYPDVSALFIDQMSNTSGQEGYYAALASYARSQGFDFVIGNPGAPTVPSYVGTVDTMVIAEGTEVPASFPSWQQGYSANNFATLTYGLASSLPESQVTANKASVAYQYVTHDGVYPDGNPWDEVSTELDTLLGLL